MYALLHGVIEEVHRRELYTIQTWLTATSVRRGISVKIRFDNERSQRRRITG